MKFKYNDNKKIKKVQYLENVAQWTWNSDKKLKNINQNNKYNQLIQQKNLNDEKM